MEQITDNMQKYDNYRTQMGRLKKALDYQFYLEAIFIEYAILEDRLESVLMHSGKWNPKPNTFYSLDSKLRKVTKLAEEKSSLIRKYFPIELTDGIEEWKKDRNQIIHALMKKSLHTEDLRRIALQGETLIKAVRNKASLYNRAIARQQAKKEK